MVYLLPWVVIFAYYFIYFFGWLKSFTFLKKKGRLYSLLYVSHTSIKRCFFLMHPKREKGRGLGGGGVEGGKG